MPNRLDPNHGQTIVGRGLDMESPHLAGYGWFLWLTGPLVDQNFENLAQWIG